MMNEDRYDKLLVKIERKIIALKIPQHKDWVDDLTSEQEEALMKLDKVINKVIGQVWDETNYDYANDLWKSYYAKSELNYIIEHLN